MKSKILGFAVVLIAVISSFAFKPFNDPCGPGSTFVVYNGSGPITSASSYTVFIGSPAPCDVGIHLCGFCVPDSYIVDGVLQSIPGSEATINIQAKLADFQNGIFDTGIYLRSTQAPL